MQNPGYGGGPVNPGYYPPQKKATPWGLIIGIGCGGCALIFIIVLVALGAVGKKVAEDVKTGVPPPQEYYGEWQGQDNSTLTIQGDGSGLYKTSNTSVGGLARWDAATGKLKIGILGIDKTFHVDAPPHDENGTQVMTLDGQVFKKTGGSTPTTSSGGNGGEDTSKTSYDKDTVPSEEACRELAKKSLLDWNEGVQSRDFTSFRATTAKEFQEAYTAAQLADVFKDFISQNINIAPIQNLTPTFDPAPSLSDGHLELKGVYPTTPNRVKFDLKYLYQDSTWKLYSIDVNTKNE